MNIKPIQNRLRKFLVAIGKNTITLTKLAAIQVAVLSDTCTGELISYETAIHQTERAITGPFPASVLSTRILNKQIKSVDDLRDL